MQAKRGEVTISAREVTRYLTLARSEFVTSRQVVAPHGRRVTLTMWVGWRTAMLSNAPIVGMPYMATTPGERMRGAGGGGMTVMVRYNPRSPASTSTAGERGAAGFSARLTRGTCVSAMNTI